MVFDIVSQSGILASSKREFSGFGVTLDTEELGYL